MYSYILAQAHPMRLARSLPINDSFLPLDDPEEISTTLVSILSLPSSPGCKNDDTTESCV